MAFSIDVQSNLRIYTRRPDGELFIAQTGRGRYDMDDVRGQFLDLFRQTFLAAPTHAILVRVK